jgi:hypothetical protein
MTDNVVMFDGITRLDLPPDRVLESALGCFASVLVIGVDHAGRLQIASSTDSCARLLLLAELAKQEILRLAEEQGP